MSKQITLTLPDEVYEQIQRTAAADQRPIAEVLTDTIVQATPIFSVDARRPAMLREQAAFRSMHADLLTTHEGEFVAVYQGEVIDHDVDELALSKRVRQLFPSAVILMSQVLPEIERVFHIRSPRLVQPE
ncbi:MAG: hypothetical protein KDI03_07755 [Anaerolineae bacterium]|nr:hypothetical protein [Anaerolineae bacterium]MCB0207011.1 hypothetical protein [Anaerolineae bacterium]